MRYIISDYQPDDDGQRECARGDHCAGRTTVLQDGKNIIVPAPTYTAYCVADRARIVNCLTDLPKRFEELSDHLGDIGTSSSGPRVSGSRSSGPPVPVNLGVDAFQRQILEILVSWEERVRAVVPLSPIDGRRRDQTAVTTASTILAAHIDALLALPADAMTRSLDLARASHLPDGATGVVHPYAAWIAYNADADGVSAGEEILRLHWRCLARLGHTPRHHDLLTACWECELPRLRRWDGTAGLADYVTCRQCGSEYLGERLALLMVEEENTLRRRATKQAS